ncbi:hypothetical protein P170DRAFT_465762 [Aspergillus steynii IBT 23096]|uniref:Uncharacterized protein n=1 Tax=Aspergillus steynii IBT 23096 TaxID=1392250 RepID=A0A2I2G674_9EURO|nr:uncharacterized protein P170DRAFT_465762 [Aspergillus steynii IBT 23096]PLB48381.1 hypothetical protein P170DRAFT_465762 [Aspergillus steynii IBT 23096]
MKYAAISIPASYGRLDSSPAPGTVAGIILGSVCGFIFLLYLIYLGISSGRRFSSTPSTVAGTGTEVSERSSRRSSRFRRGPGSRRRDDVVEVEEGRSDGDSRIVVEESMTSGGRSRDEGLVEVIEEEEGRERPGRKGRGGIGGIDK